MQEHSSPTRLVDETVGPKDAAPKPYGKTRTQSVEPVTIAVELSINGKNYALLLDPRTTLLDALREHLHFTGTKKGCDHGQCGACTVHVNGRRVNSCLCLAANHAGDEITTIEGIGNSGALHPMQATFVECDGYQCGYCPSGQIVRGKA
jgi:xanthine dehydrogenase YagT iron-sulfur-binding subunit